MRHDTTVCKILAAIGRHGADGVQNPDLAVDPSIGADGGTIAAYTSALRARGLITSADDYRGNRRVLRHRITGTGKDALERSAAVARPTERPRLVVAKTAPADEKPEAPGVEQLEQLLDRQRKRAAPPKAAAVPDPEFAAGVFHDDSLIIQHAGQTLVLPPDRARELGAICIRHYRTDIDNAPRR